MRGRDLLLSVGPSLCGALVALDDQTVEIEIHSLLADLEDEVGVARNVARVVDDWQVGYAPVQLNGDLPLRVVAILDLLVYRESAMDDAELLDSRAVKTLERAYPELKIGVDGILDEDGHIRPAERVGDLLDSERVGRGARADPYHVDSVFNGLVDVLRRGHLDGGVHTRLALDPLQPRQTDRTYALERAWASARLPDACTENLDAAGGELTRSVHNLFLGLGAAGTGDDEGSFAVHAREEYGLEFELCFHIYVVVFLFDWYDSEDKTS